MKTEEAIQILEQHNKWRRGEDDISMIEPSLLGEAIETVVSQLKQPSPIEEEKDRACPCLYLEEPCNPNCTCKNPYSSAGCDYCCSYGSIEQRKHMAELLALKLHTPSPSTTVKEEVEPWYYFEDSSIEGDISYIISSRILGICICASTKEQAVKEFAKSVMVKIFYQEKIEPTSTPVTEETDFEKEAEKLYPYETDSMHFFQTEDERKEYLSRVISQEPEDTYRKIHIRARKMSIPNNTGLQKLIEELNESIQAIEKSLPYCNEKDIERKKSYEYVVEKATSLLSQQKTVDLQQRYSDIWNAGSLREEYESHVERIGNDENWSHPFVPADKETYLSQFKEK